MEGFRKSQPRWIPWLAFVVAAGVVTVGGEWVVSVYRLGPVDDAFISLRYAANWAGGRGLVFNAGESIEGYTNFLLVVLEAAAIRCGMEPVTAMLWIGRLSLAALGGLLAVFIVQRVFPGRSALAIVAGCVVGLNPALVCWGTSGLEGCLAAALVLGSVLAATAARGHGGAVASALLLALAGMTRPDAVVVLPALLLAVYWCGRSWRSVAWLAVVFLVGFGVYWAGRAVHFGYLFPNTFYAKVDYGGAWLARRGALYVLDFVVASPLIVALALAGLALMRRSPVWVRVCWLCIVLQLVATVYVGGDHFAMFRLMVPTVVLLSVAALYPVARAVERWRGPGGRAGTVVLITLAVIAGSHLWMARQPKRGEEGGARQFERYVVECRLAEQWSTMGRWFGGQAPRDASLATIAIGAVGYYSDLRIVDPLGLVDAHVAHLERELGHGAAGHEKYDVGLVLSREPDYILLANVLTPRALPLEALRAMSWGAFGDQLAREPALSRAYRYENVLIGGGRPRYMNVFVRRDLPPLSGG